MKQRVFALVGVSGVGKTTFLKRLRSILEFQHLSAGTLILEARKASHAERDAVRIRDVGENQRFLLSGFQMFRDKCATRVVLDGHVVIHTLKGIETISPSVFEAIGIDGLLHLSAPPEAILGNRTSDASRSRPQLSVLEISEHQDISLSGAKKIAAALNIPFCEVSGDDLTRAQHFMG